MWELRYWLARFAIWVSRLLYPPPEAYYANPSERRDEKAIRLLHQLRDLCDENSTMGAQINDWLVLIPHAETPPTEGPKETR